MPSQKVATYDLKPEMSAPGIADEMIGTLEAGKHQVVICNFANADMVGHTGRLDAAIAAVETLDTCLGRIVETLKLVGGRAVITADHGNAEQMWDDDAQGAAHGPHLQPGAGDPLRRGARRTAAARRLAPRCRADDAGAAGDREVAGDDWHAAVRGVAGCQTGNGQMADGRWQMADGRWQMADGR